MNLSNNKILITGGGSGIGLGLTERFYNENNTVIICGRRQEALQQVKSKFPNIITRVCDLAEESQRQDLYNWISKNHSDLNVLVNNAGIQNWIKIEDDDFYNRASQEITTNILAPLHLISLFANLKSLKTLINVTSGLAFMPFTKVPVYSATKAFFHSFTLSTRYLLKSKNIEVIELIPPALNTDLGGKGLHDSAPPVSDFIDSVFKQLHEGKTEITFGFSEAISKANPEEIKAHFERMNPS
ncbi:SDR family oxidoreductase [Leeuwenhoekiella sp. A16]|uniref:SDR family oxidoreductase n=1 Tax=unclassified Leeuwenhoekiella TaxID=2615029 RepID=UPI003A8125BF